uniref:Uncharacterized protein n=1 Tax=viral metagenome TaxID=1070528 RepID=A0A6M3J9G5_9ZZZZ
MTLLFCFLSGVAFLFILLLAWSLCRASADADRLTERLHEQERGEP